MNTIMIVFMSIITIVGMVLTYKLLVLIIDRKNGGQGPTQRNRPVNHPGPPDQAAWQDLAERASDLSRRLQNLEDILIEEKEDGEE